jgi:lipoprotein-releasing system ATP-binding protein
MPDFVAEQIVKEFQTANGPLRVLDGIDLKLNRGQNLVVLGPSGSGKSTFLHIAGTLDSPSSGRLLINGQSPAGLSEPKLAEFRNQHIGFVFQEHHLLPQLTALENVLVPVIPHAGNHRGALERAKGLLEAVELTDRLEHRPGMLSGGERQRVAVARALICDPVLLLADEPTGSLDQKNAEIIGQLLLNIQRQSNMILICVTHSDRLASLFDQRVELQNGKFVPVN